MEKVVKKEGQQSMTDFVIIDSISVCPGVGLLKLKPSDNSFDLVDNSILPGQFVQVLPPENSTFLRRPISICFVDSKTNQLWLLVRDAGSGTNAILNAKVNSILSLILPLGNGFNLRNSGTSPLLIGGGVGTAPLLMLGATLKQAGIQPTFLLGAKTHDAILLEEQLKEFGNVYISTDDGTYGEPGLVTHNPILKNKFSSIYCCGPLPMMKAVAKIARDTNTPCQVSLENVMGCGIGACLCCVEKTVAGNLCVCKDGPVFNIEQLLWQN